MNQTGAVATFFTGITTFFGVGGEILTQHKTWAEFYQTPIGMGHAFILGVAFLAMVGGALKIQMPRAGRPHGDRATDPPHNPVNAVNSVNDPQP